MKKIIAVLSLGFLVITVCLLYLVKSGVSLRAKTLIRPSVMNPDQLNLAQGVVLRLFPELQTSHVVVWGVKPETAESAITLALLKAEFEKDFGVAVNLIPDGNKASIDEIKACSRPCWILVEKNQANHLDPSDFLTEKMQVLQRPYLTVTWVPFVTGAEIPEGCVQEKRLTFECLKSLSVHEAERKIKTEDRYFFMKMYNDRDVFLFVQKPKDEPAQ